MTLQELLTHFQKIPSTKNKRALVTEAFQFAQKSARGAETKIRRRLLRAFHRHGRNFWRRIGMRSETAAAALLHDVPKIRT